MEEKELMMLPPGNVFKILKHDYISVGNG